MTPIAITRQARSMNVRDGHPALSKYIEIWGAFSTDGVWTYEREDSPGTPWQVIHEPTGRWAYYGSLPEARRATANGEALRDLDGHQDESAPAPQIWVV